MIENSTNWNRENRLQVIELRGINHEASREKEEKEIKKRKRENHRIEVRRKGKERIP